MKTISVQVRDDHLAYLAAAKPSHAMAELIWNALDAEATEVRVEFEENGLSGIESLCIRDNGHGLHYEHALSVFKNLGGSWKEEGQRTAQRKRLLHGKYGKGRFRAFSLGGMVQWQAVYEDAGARHAYQIAGRKETLGEFVVSDPKEASETPTGMTALILNPEPCVDGLRGDKARQDMTDIFALYLRQYPEVHIVYDGAPLDPAMAEDRVTDYDLGAFVTESGERIHAALTVVEWLIPGKRGVLLCDASGFALHPAKPKPAFRGFSYTAYVKSQHISMLDREGLLVMDELSADVRQLVDAARTRLRQHFALREAERAQDILAVWRETGLYPYEGEPAGESEETERRIFDIYATHLAQLGDFQNLGIRNKRIILQLMREVVHADPTRVVRILDEALSFPEEKEEAVLGLLEE